MICTLRGVCFCKSFNSQGNQKVQKNLDDFGSTAKVKWDEKKLFEGLGKGEEKHSRPASCPIFPIFPYIFSLPYFSLYSFNFPYMPYIFINFIRLID